MAKTGPRMNRWNDRPLRKLREARERPRPGSPVCVFPRPSSLLFDPHSPLNIRCGVETELPYSPPALGSGCEHMCHLTFWRPDEGISPPSEPHSFSATSTFVGSAISNRFFNEDGTVRLNSPGFPGHTFVVVLGSFNVTIHSELHRKAWAHPRRWPSNRGRMYAQRRVRQAGCSALCRWVQFGIRTSREGKLRFLRS